MGLTQSLHLELLKAVSKDTLTARSGVRRLNIVNHDHILVFAVMKVWERALARGEVDPNIDGRAALDELVLPSTHNAFSSASDGFLLAEQQEGVAAQLQAGIRGLRLLEDELLVTFGGREAALPSSLSEPARDEGLAGPVLASDGLEAGATRGDHQERDNEKQTCKS